MKLLVVALTALVAFATVDSHFLPAFGEGPLYEDVQYFMDMIPMQKVVKIFLQYASEDTEVQAYLRYMKSDDFTQMLKEIEAIPELHHFINYLQKNGLYMYDIMDKLNKAVGLPPYERKMALLGTQGITGGLKGLFRDIKEQISYDLFIHGYVHKMRTSPAFRDFVAELKSSNHQGFVNALYTNQRYLKFRSGLVSRNIDVALVEDIIYTVLGIQFPDFNTYALYENQLSKDIHEFLALLDMNKIMEIVSAHLEDEQVQKAVTYMYSEEFHVLVRTVEAMKEYQDLVFYLHNAGLDVFGLIQKVHKLFGMEDYVPPAVPGTFSASMESYANMGGIKGLVDDVIETLPMDKIKALYQEKMRDSPAFRNFIEKLRSPDFKRIVDTVYSTPIFLEMRQKAIDAGLDLAPVRELIKKVFGLDLHVPMPVALHVYAMYENQLSKDIHEFLALLDMNKVMEIVSAHLEDEQVQKAVTYMYSEEFHVLVRTVEAMKEYQDLVFYLHNAGLDVFGLIQKVHKLFGMEDYVPPAVPGTFSASMKTYANMGGIKGLVDDVIETLPMDKIKALYQEKMRDSPAFRNFIEKLRSPDFKRIVDTVYSTPIFLEMRQKAIDAGLDLAPVRELIKKVFGLDLHVPMPVAFHVYALYENQLSKDIHEFLALLDMNKVMEIVSAHLEDEQVQKAVTYMYSEEFHVLVRKIEAMKEYQDLVLYLHNAGLDVFGLIQKVHKLFGMEDYVPPAVPGTFSASMKTYANMGGIKGLVDDVIETLPMDKIKALYQEKMRDSPAFRNFIEKLRSPDFKRIVDTVYSTPIFLEMRQKAIDAGLDLAPVRELIKKVFGLDLHVPMPVAFHVYAMYENQLSKDIQEFLALLDKKKITKIVAVHLADSQVQKALHYIRGEEFHALVRKVEAMKEYQDLVLYLQNAGLDVFGLIQKVHKLFGMEDYVPPAVPGTYSASMETYVNLGGIKGLVDDVIKTLPMDKIKALYQEKMRDSPAFRNFIEKLQSPDFKRIVDTVYSTPIFLEMRQKAIDAGLELEPVRELIKKILGIDLPVH